MNKRLNLLVFLTLLTYLISNSFASFYMLKGFTNAEYLNISASSYTITYPINAVATTTINVSATYLTYNQLGNASAYINGLNNIMLSGINGSVFEGNLSFIPYQNGILIPKYTLQGNTYKTLAIYWNSGATSCTSTSGSCSASTSGYSGLPFRIKTYTDNLQNNYEFVYYSFLNYNLTTMQGQTIPAQPNNNTDTGGTFKVSFDTLTIPYYLFAFNNTNSAYSYLNLTYYRGSGVVARQIQAVYSNSNVILIGNGKAYMQNANNYGGLLLNPNGKIWFGYLNIPLYYYNYNITNATTTNSVPIGIYYANYNYVLNIPMPNTQKVYPSPNYFYFLMPAFNTANVIATTSNTTQVIALPKFEYQFNLTNINWSMHVSDYLNWSGGYNIYNFNPANTTENPSFSTNYLMFSLPAYPCLQSSNGQYGAIQVFGYSGTTNEGQIPIAEWQVQNNRVYYVMPSKTSKGLTYTQALAYICTAKPIQSQLNNTIVSQFIIAKYTGSGKAVATSYSRSMSNFIAFVNPTLFYGNESLYAYASSGSQYLEVQAQTFSLITNMAGMSGTSKYLNILANYPLYIWVNASAYYNGAYDYCVPQVWFRNGYAVPFEDTNNVPDSENFNNFYAVYSVSNTTTKATGYLMPYPFTFYINLPYNATATLVNFFTTKYVLGNLTGIATTSSSNSSSVSNPVITPASPKLNLTITNSTIANNLANLKTTLNKSIVLYGITLPLGTIYIVLLLVIVALAVLSKSEGALIIALAVLWLTGLFFIPELVIAGIITLAYATYRLEGLFKNRG